MTAALCPYCLFRFEANGQLPSGFACEQCDRRLPRLYLEDGLHSPTDIVLCMGRTGNGKTTLLMSLLGTLITRPDRLSPGAAIGTYASASDDGASAIEWAREAYGAFLTQGLLPEGTALSARPVPFYLLGCPPDGRRRNLFLFDVGGEVFKNVYSLAESAHFAAQTRVLWVIVSLDRTGLAEQSMGDLGGNLWDILDTYVSAREEVRIDRGLEKLPQALLVVFTKADARGALLPELSPHIQRTTFSTPTERRQVSDILRLWLATDTDGGAGAIAHAEAQFDRVEYCAVSSTGGRVSLDGGELRTEMKPQPRLIFDPIAWTWELTRWMGERRKWSSRFKSRIGLS